MACVSSMHWYKKEESLVLSAGILLMASMSLIFVFHADSYRLVLCFDIWAEYCPLHQFTIGSIFFPLRVAPIRIDTNFKGHEIE